MPVPGMLRYILIQLISFPWGDWRFIKFEVQKKIFFPILCLPLSRYKYLLKGFVIVARSILFLNLTDYFHLWINHEQHTRSFPVYACLRVSRFQYRVRCCCWPYKVKIVCRPHVNFTLLQLSPYKVTQRDRTASLLICCSCPSIC